MKVFRNFFLWSGITKGSKVGKGINFVLRGERFAVLCFEPFATPLLIALTLQSVGVFRAVYTVCFITALLPAAANPFFTVSYRYIPSCLLASLHKKTAGNIALPAVA